MNEIPDAATALAIAERCGADELWKAVGAVAACVVIAAVFCIGAYPSISRAYRRVREFAKAHPLQALALAVMAVPLIHYGSTKFVAPVTEVSQSVTETGVAFEWTMAGHRDTTQYVIYRTGETEPGVTNRVQHAIVTGETAYEDAFPGADAWNWAIQYLPPVVVEGDEIQITSFEATNSGLRFSWRVKEKVQVGTDVFDVKMRYRVIPSRTGWSAWRTIQSGTATNYADSVFHHFRDEEWKVECTKEED